jgi:hypothetical protein
VRNIPTQSLESEVIRMIALDKTSDGFVKANASESLPPGSPVFGITLLMQRLT